MQHSIAHMQQMLQMAQAPLVQVVILHLRRLSDLDLVGKVWQVPIVPAVTVVLHAGNHLSQ